MNKKTYDRLILDERKRISALYLIAIKEDTLKEDNIKKNLTSNELNSLFTIFRYRSSYILQSIFNILVEKGLDYLIYIEHHAGHRSNEL